MLRPYCPYCDADLSEVPVCLTESVRQSSLGSLYVARSSSGADPNSARVLFDHYETEDTESLGDDGHYECRGCDSTFGLTGAVVRDDGRPSPAEEARRIRQEEARRGNDMAVEQGLPAVTGDPTVANGRNGRWEANALALRRCGCGRIVDLEHGAGVPTDTECACGRLIRVRTD